MEAGISGARLMRRAASAAWQALRTRWPQATQVIVLAGPGNNGGDGYLLAVMAQAAGIDTSVFRYDEPPATGDVAAAYQHCLQQGGRVAAYAEGALAEVGAGAVIVDALFGIGLSRPLAEPAQQLVAAVAAARARGAGVIALDLPSGLNASTGAVLGAAIGADLTVSFIAPKLGLYTGCGPDYVGELLIATLDVPAELYQGTHALGRLMAAEELALALPPRRRSAHKGTHGHVLIVGGDSGMAGAALLAARAALRAGAGLVSLATRSAHAATLVSAQPEIMVHGIEDAEALQPLLERAHAVAIGPGLGHSAWGQAMLRACAQHPHVLVDADALTLLAGADFRNPLAVLTPHPGEAARLLACTSAQIQADRLRAVRALAALTSATVVLKGAGSLVQSGDGPVLICPYGNPGMGVGGMGDALTGIIAAFLAQGLPEAEAAAMGVLAHALAGDAAAAAGGERGLLPSDLIDALRGVVNPPRAAKP